MSFRNISTPQKSYLMSLLCEPEPQEPNEADAGVFFDLFIQLYELHQAGGAERVRQALPSFPELKVLFEEQCLDIEAIKQLKPPQYLLKPRLFEEGLHVLYGPSGVGKTFFALHDALTIAQQHDVLYVPFEGRRGYRGRVGAWMKQHQVKEARFHMLFLNDFSLLDPYDVELFLARVWCEGLAPKLIVFDTLSYCLAGGDENSAGDMQLAVKACRQIQIRTGAAILLIHHSGKNGGQERGSTALRSAADMVMKLSRKKPNEPILQLVCDKPRESEPFPDELFKLVKVEVEKGLISSVIMPHDASEPELSDCEEEIFQAIGELMNKGEDATYSVIKRQTEIANPRKYLKSLIAKGLVEQLEEKGPYLLAPAGIDRFLDDLNSDSG